ncbi:MAG: rRNA maturation RNase YbeY [Sulfitobacter sp.]
MDALDVVIEDARWADCDLEGLSIRAARGALEHLGLPAQLAEITVLGCDDARITVLNGDFRAKPSPTNVLSWPAEERAAAQPGGNPVAVEPDPDGTLPLGDIAISYDTCTREAAQAGKPLADHTLHLVVHGILHLLGYDHETDADAALMEGLETAILENMGLADPYHI